MSFFIRQLLNSFGVFFRTIRAFFSRKLTGVGARLRQVTNFSRNATKVATASFQGAATVVKKPTKREDYIETDRLFISKSFLLLLAVALVAFVLLCKFLVWPFLLSHFLTARFWQEDKRVPDWTGKVIVYYDKKKKIPMYSGRLEDGLLQGEGKEYDEEGLLTYEGTFQDGVRSGSGACYRKGVLIYEGQLLDGVYEGSGRLFDQDGLLYEGSFADGLPSGSGASYRNGVLYYQGGFADGLRQGSGEEYYADGTVKYKGSFAKDRYDGEGAYYLEDGSLRYRGGFASGLYEGEGTVYLDGGQIRASFSAGFSTGSIQWYQEGHLWYEGGADNLCPDGFGTVYAASGKAVYAGEMDQGTLDGAWMLGLTAGELRETFGEASVTETDGGNGFYITNDDLGLTALCSYQQGEEVPQVYRLWFAPGVDSAAAALLPWEDLSEANSWARLDREVSPESAVDYGAVPQPGGGTRDWYQSWYGYGEYTCTLLSAGGGSAPVQILWSRGGQMPAGGGASADASLSQAQEKLDSLLGALDALSGETGSGSGGGSGSGAGAAGVGNPADIEALLRQTATPKDAYDLMNALINSYVYDQAITALEATRPLEEKNLENQRVLLERGETTQEMADAVQDRLDGLDRQLYQYRVLRQEAEYTVQKLTGRDTDGMDLSASLRVVDVSGIDAAALYSSAVDYAEEVAAGGEEVDTKQLSVDIKNQILDLTVAFENVGAAQRTLEQARTVLEQSTQAYAKGSLDREALYDAQGAVGDAASAMIQTIGAYTSQFNRLNYLSGGWVAQRYGWFPAPFQELRDSAIQAAQEAAEARRLEEEARLEEERRREERLEELESAVEELKNRPDGSADGAEPDSSAGDASAGPDGTPTAGDTPVG